MSLLKKASIITTPTAYAEDYLYSIKPAYALGSELIINGNFATDSNWIKGTGWTISGGEANCNSGSSTELYQSLAVSGKTYKITFTITSYTSGQIAARAGGITGVVRTSIGTFTDTITANGTQLGVFNSGGFVGSIDNVSVKEITDADFDFTRNSTGTRLNEDYLIEDVPYNLNTYSEDFDQWTKINVTVSSDQILAPDGTLSADKLIATSGASNKVIFQGITAGTYTASVFAKKGEFEGLFIGTGTVGAFFNLNTYAYRTHYTSPPTSYQIESYGNGWYRYSITFTESSNNNLYIGPNDNVSTTLAITGDGSKGIYIWGAQLVKGDQPKDYLKTTDRLDIPRIDYTNGEPSILLEPQRVNLQTFSTDLNNALTVGSPVTITSNVTTSPENLQNADKITQTLTSLYQSRFSTITITAGSTWTRSIFAKKDTGNWLYLQQYDGVTNNGAYFDLENGVIGTIKSGITARMVEYPNGWYRCSVTNTPNATATTERIQVALVDADNTSANKTGNGTGIFIYGAQFEEGSYATSLIHTSGSAVTRSADAATNAGNSDLFNDSEGVLYAEISSLSLSGGDGYISITDGTASNRITLRNTSTLNNVVSQCVVGGVNQASMDFILQDRTLKNKIAFRYKANDFSLYVNGQEVLIDTSGTVPSGLKELSFNNGAGVGQWYGNAKMVAVFKEALTDLELEKLTGYNNHELYMNYYNRLSYLGLVEEYNVESDINNYIL